ncbi:MAG TPA: ATP-binding cassette domain-containing protein, partial [Anaerolineae bacterium]|nr:ATP-binding cassette domain-containing protein [Anaerolineae bacterium]
MKGISKRFGSVQALKNVDLELRRGEVLGLVGDNAAGKSTLMKCLSGAVIPDEGEVFVEGQKVMIRNPVDARALGIEMI